MANKKTILIVDDHTLFREGLKAIISRNTAYDVVGETGRADSAMQMARALRPDLMLVDISLPDQSGIELTLQLRKSLPKTAIMMVTMHSKVDYIVNAFQAGAPEALISMWWPMNHLSAMPPFEDGPGSKTTLNCKRHGKKKWLL